MQETLLQQGVGRGLQCREGNAAKHEARLEEAGEEGGEEVLAHTAADAQPVCVQVEESLLHQIDLQAVTAAGYEEAVACGCQQVSQSLPCHSLPP